MIKRLVTCFSPIPGWIEAISGIDGHTCFKETITIDRNNNSFVAISNNLTCRSLSTSYEVCKYNNAPKDKNCTLFTQDARMEFYLPVVNSALEDFSESRFRTNAKKGLEIMEELCVKNL